MLHNCHSHPDKNKKLITLKTNKKLYNCHTDTFEVNKTDGGTWYGFGKKNKNKNFDIADETDTWQTL